MATKTGFIKDYQNNILLPITRAELVKDAAGQCAFHSSEFAADNKRYGLMSPADKAKLNGDGSQSLSGLDALIKRLNTSIQVNTAKLDLLSTGLNISDSGQIKATFDKGTLQLTLSDPLPLTSASVKDVLENDEAIVNKKWVSDQIQAQFADAIQIATGSLKFKGLLEQSVNADDLKSSKVGDFYKVGNKDITVNGTSVRSGDTILVAEEEDGSKYWCIIPSGDEIQTTLSVKDDYLLGSINLVSGSSDLVIALKKEPGDVGGTITFTQNPAKVENGIVTSGSFSQQVYNELSKQITAGVNYTSLVRQGVPVGTLGGGDITIPTLIVDNTDKVPIIKYNDVKNDGIKITSGNGIAITQEEDSELHAALKVNTSKQLEFKDGNLQLNVWGDNNSDDNGLITFNTLASAVSANVLFTAVEDPNNLTKDEIEYLDFENTSTNN